MRPRRTPAADNLTDEFALVAPGQVGAPAEVTVLARRRLRALGMLGAANRTEAVARARELGLIP